MMDRAWDIVVGVAIAALTALAAAWAGRMRRERRLLRQMAADWAGTPARPGVDERPGMMLRMQRVEEAQADLRAVVAELLPDHGNTMRDMLARIEVAVGATRNEE